MLVDQDLFELAASHSLIDSQQLSSLFAGLDLLSGDLRVSDQQMVREGIEQLARAATFGPPNVVHSAHRLAWRIALEMGVFPASIDTLYRDIGSGELSQKFTVPAVNMRALTFHSACGVFQAMQATNAGAVIFELSRGEIGFTAQRPHEYATAILCAAIAENHSGPVFLQGDHFQISASRYAEDPDKEVLAVEDLIREAVSAGFFNIDIDASTLVDLSYDDIGQQQELNARLTAHFAALARALEPDGVTISLGGEIGEVGEHNSTPKEVRAFLAGVDQHLSKNQRGISKLSVQSGTRHGGNVLPDGSFGDMPIDFELINKLSNTCREDFKVAGCVQHGASMLSMEKIALLPPANCVEVHLAAAFLNAVYDNLPAATVTAADDWVKAEFAHEWKDDWSEAQFLHHARRYPIGPFKENWWRHQNCHAPVREEVRARADTYIRALNASNTRELVSLHVGHAPVERPPISQDINSDLDEAQIHDLVD